MENDGRRSWPASEGDPERNTGLEALFAGKPAPTKGPGQLPLRILFHRRVRMRSMSSGMASRANSLSIISGLG